MYVYVCVCVGVGYKARPFFFFRFYAICLDKVAKENEIVKAKVKRRATHRDYRRLSRYFSLLHFLPNFFFIINVSFCVFDGSFFCVLFSLTLRWFCFCFCIIMACAFDTWWSVGFASLSFKLSLGNWSNRGSGLFAWRDVW